MLGVMPILGLRCVEHELETVFCILCSHFSADAFGMEMIYVVLVCRSVGATTLVRRYIGKS